MYDIARDVAAFGGAGLWLWFIGGVAVDMWRKRQRRKERERWFANGEE